MASRLQDLLTSWRWHRSNAVADELDALSDALLPHDRPRHLSELLRHRWTELELGALLAALPPARHPLLGACLDRFWAHPVDPRMATALQRLVVNELPRSDDLSFWNRALPLIAWIGDVRAAAWLGDAMGEVNGPALATRTLVLRANELIVQLGLRPHEPSRKLACALQAAASLPDDPLERVVHADQLLERGDVRGELIILQSLPSPRRDQRRRTSVVLRDYGRAMLGRLGPALKSTGLRFEFGAVVAGQLSGYRALPPLVNAEEWRTVEDLDLAELVRRAPRGPLLLEFLSQPSLGRLRVLRNFPVRELDQLRDWPRPLPVRELHLVGWGVGGQHLEGLHRRPSLPALERLTVNGRPPEAG